MPSAKTVRANLERQPQFGEPKSTGIRLAGCINDTQIVVCGSCVSSLTLLLSGATSSGIHFISEGIMPIIEAMPPLNSLERRTRTSLSLSQVALDMTRRLLTVCSFTSASASSSATAYLAGLPSGALLGGSELSTFQRRWLAMAMAPTMHNERSLCLSDG